MSAWSSKRGCELAGPFILTRSQDALEKLILKACEAEKIDPTVFKIVHSPSDTAAAAKAVDLINSGAYSHPFFWSAFVLNGLE